MYDKPYPLEAGEIRPAMEAIESDLEILADLAEFDGELDEEDTQAAFDLLMSWNALERHLAYIEQRPFRNITGEIVGEIGTISLAI